MKQVSVVAKLRSPDLGKTARETHRETLKNVLDYLKTLPVRVRIIDRSRLSRKLKGDLILTVGGDGTVLAASHFAGRIPLLGINSAPQTSTGFFCLAAPANFREKILSVVTGRRKPISLFRLRVSIEGRPFPFPALNDILFASRLQGETARYTLQIGDIAETQKSSGVWVATGAGSTAAILSAGGKKDPLFSRRLQYKVREPFCFPQRRYQLPGGFLKPGQKLTLISRMKGGMIFLDGARLAGKVPKDGKVTIQGGQSPLKIFL